MKNFSVVIPVHRSANPDYLFQAIESIVNQSNKPEEIVIVFDGPVTNQILNVVNDFIDKSKVVLVRLDENVGPGTARHEGILKAKNDIIALMDSDDISRFSRFEDQIKILTNEDVDVVGSLIEEFNITPGDLRQFRETPEKHKDIAMLGKWRMPVNHVTLVFKKDAYLNTGGYRKMKSAEDYYLISRMLCLNIKFYNIQSVLVDVRIETSLKGRRNGLSFLVNELSVFQSMYASGYITMWIFLSNVIIRVFTRLLPSKMTYYMYSTIFRKRIKK